MKGLKFLLALLISTILISCEHEITEKDFYMNCDVEIVEMWRTGHHNHCQDKSMLVRLIDDTTMYRELGEFGNIAFTDEEWYNWNIGDTLHYDYLGKKMFFRRK